MQHDLALLSDVTCSLQTELVVDLSCECPIRGCKQRFSAFHTNVNLPSVVSEFTEERLQCPHSLWALLPLHYMIFHQLLKHAHTHGTLSLAQCISSKLCETFSHSSALSGGVLTLQGWFCTLRFTVVWLHCFFFSWRRWRGSMLLSCRQSISL